MHMHIHTHKQNAPVHPVDTDCFTDYLCVQSQGLWDLYSDMELNMIPVLAGEDHFILLNNPEAVHLWRKNILECP